MPASPDFPSWLLLLSWSGLCLGCVCAIVIGADIARHPQRMAIMNVVWPVTALFGTLFVGFTYFRYGRNAGHEKAKSETPFPVAVAHGTLHCGAGCTLGDILAETLAFRVPAVAIWFGWQSVFADKIFAVWCLDFVLAFGLGIIFQYFAIAPMRNLSLRDGLVAAFKADTLSLICWQLGMYAMMYAAQSYLAAQFGGRANADSPVFWFAMQIAMIAGFITSYPANWRLITSGIKEKM